MSAYRTGHTHWSPGRPGDPQLEISPIEISTGETQPKVGADPFDLLGRAEELCARLDRHDAVLDSIGAALAALRGPA